MARSARRNHDARYHRLFSHPGVVAQLLRGFVDAADLADLDLDAMERLNAKFHAESGERRESDMIWRIPRSVGQGQDSYLVLLLEFQSQSDRHMALRVLTYAALLWQHLLTEQRLPEDGMLPPLLPVVVYNGETRWGAPDNVRELVGLPQGSVLWRWQPQSRYHVIDAGAFKAADLAARDGLPALWFRLETASDSTAALAVADDLLAWLARHPGYAAAQAVFTQFLRELMAGPGRPARIPRDLQKVRDMLMARARQWEQGWLREGRREGEAGLLLRQLERRFGVLPDWVRGRVGAADTATLEDWALRILDGGSLAELFGEPPAQG